MATVSVEKAPQATGGWIGAFESLSRAWEYLKANNQPVQIALGVVLVLSVVEAFTSGVVQVVATIAGSLVTLLFLLAATKYALFAADGVPATNDNVFAFDLKRYLLLLATSVVGGILSALSLILFIIPAIWVIPWLSLYAFASVDKKLGVIESLKESKRLAVNHKGKIWAIIGTTFLLSFAVATVSGFLGAVWGPLGVILQSVTEIVTSLLSVIMLAYFYRWSNSQSTDVNPQ